MSISTTPESKDDGEYQKICDEHKKLIETSAKSNGWWLKPVYNYNAFWLNSNSIKTNLILHIYFKSQPTDIFCASFMKSGTTWLKALVFSTLNREQYTFSDHHLLHHGPHSTFNSLNFESYPLTDFTHLPAPRLFSFHFAYTLLPMCITTTSCKLVYIYRDPKDVLISKWDFMNKIRTSDMPPLPLKDAFELYCQGVSEYGPFWEHVLSYWRASLENPDKILFLKYEELKKQPEAMVRKLALFLGKPFTKEEEENGVVENIVKLCSFENLSNLDVNKKGTQVFTSQVKVNNEHFFRKGETGDWKNYLTEDMKQRIDEITHEKFKGSGLIP